MPLVIRVQLLEVDQKRSTAPRRHTEAEAGTGINPQDMQAEVKDLVHFFRCVYYCALTLN
jgi:hypothetical protein